MKLKDRVAIIVGGGSGIGRASAKLLASEGATLMIGDWVIEAADAVAEEIRADGGEVSTMHMDMTKEEDCIKLAKVTVEKYGKIDILCNIAGGSMGYGIRDGLQPFLEQDKKMWDHMIDINLNGPRNCTHAVLPYMIERNYGKIVSFASIAGVTGMPGGTDYAAAKAGVIAMMRNIAMEMGQYGICANTITPSGTNSERIRKYMLGGQTQEQQQRSISMFAEPEDLAESVLLLVSSASDHISGQNFIYGVPAMQGPSRQ
ncbi:MAG: SDR family oxidoreductase [Dehalococcoidales bacterium]|nr:SDR family oxidoreductase [Dehalococcoidales bacterium]